jgi:hypothetical protein
VRDNCELRICLSDMMLNRFVPDKAVGSVIMLATSTAQRAVANNEHITPLQRASIPSQDNNQDNSLRRMHLACATLSSTEGGATIARSISTHRIIGTIANQHIR